VLPNSVASGEVGFSALAGEPENVSPSGVRWCGLERPEGEERPGLEFATAFWLAAAFKRSSVARRRASRASSSEVWEETFCFLGMGVSVLGWEIAGAWGSGVCTSQKQQRRGLRESCRF
jgi:hypothetical protein